MSERQNEPSEGEARVAGTRQELVSRLFREHNEALLRFLVAKLHSEQEAKDVAQEAYVRMLKLDSPEVVSHLRAYLFKTAANLAVDRLRARALENRVGSLEFFEDGDSHGEPGRRLAASEELQLILECLQELPPKCRQAFLLRRIEDMSSSEIARVLGVPERTVRHYIVEAIVYCQSRLQAASG